MWNILATCKGVKADVYSEKTALPIGRKFSKCYQGFNSDKITIKSLVLLNVDNEHLGLKNRLRFFLFEIFHKFIERKMFLYPRN